MNSRPLIKLISLTKVTAACQSNLVFFYFITNTEVKFLEECFPALADGGYLNAYLVPLSI